MTPIPKEHSIRCSSEKGDMHKIRRMKNNEAVKKSREKTKKNTKEMIDKVEKLKFENDDLQNKINTLNKELDLLKQMFIEHAGNSHPDMLSKEERELLQDEYDSSYESYESSLSNDYEASD